MERFSEWYNSNSFAVFASGQTVKARLAQSGLIKGKTIGVDSTTLEANAAMKSIVCRHNGESYNENLKRVATAEGAETTDTASLRRMDRKRKKKTSNKDW
jgi:transposase